MTEPAEVARAVAEAHRREWAVVLAATACAARDLDLAEDCVQEAYTSALVAWARAGIPDNPAAWLTTIAKRRAMDAVRRERAFRSKLPLLVEPEKTVDDEVVMGQQAAGGGEDAVPDERLRLIFMCCNPALAPEAQVALTLRLVCGMPTADIARTFLVSETAMGARLTRAKRKISAARIPVRVPGAAELPDRLQTVLGVIHLLFTMGHTASSGESLMRPELVDRALHLTRVLLALMPDEREIRGLLALLLVTDARRATRVGANGRLLQLAEQDRSQWDRSAIAEAHDLIMDGLRAGDPGATSCRRRSRRCTPKRRHTTRPTGRRSCAYTTRCCLSVWPSPVVALNRAVAVSMVSGPQEARRRSNSSRRTVGSRDITTCQPSKPTCCDGWATRPRQPMPTAGLWS
jgi:RNA polymerase sigma factor (sigma-70 family)